MEEGKTDQAGSSMLNDLLGKERASVLSEEAGYYLDQARILGMREMRPWGKEFFAVFKPPQWNYKYVETRMITNLLYYRTNYLIIGGIISALMVLASPFLIITIVACIVFTWGCNSIKGPIVIGETTLTQIQKAYACLGINALLFFVTGSAWQSIKIIMYSVGFCGVHMLFRPRSITANSNKMYEEFKLSGFFGFGDSDAADYVGDSLLDMEAGGQEGSLRKRGK
jgi:hypothetical protein